MKYIVLVFSLFASISLAAQDPSSPAISGRNRTIYPTESYSTTELDRLRSAQEIRLEQLLGTYRDLRGQARGATQAEILELLYSIFDLDMAQKYREAKSLKEQLDAMVNDPNHRHQANELKALRRSLEKVESNLRYRSEYRQQIVIQRFKDLTEQR